MKKDRQVVKLTTSIEIETRQEFVKLSLKLAARGIIDGHVGPGKIIDALVMSDQAFDILAQFFLQTDLSKKCK